MHKHNNIEAACELLKRGANVDLLDVDGKRPFYLLPPEFKSTITEFAQKNHPFRRLYAAITNDDVDEVDRIAAEFAKILNVFDPDVQKENTARGFDLGYSPIHIAAMQSPRVLEHLMKDHTSNINLRYEVSQQTPLGIACMSGCVPTALYLLENGANPNAQNMHGDTPLHMACSRGDIDLVALLLNYRANKDVDNNSHKKPFDLLSAKTLVRLDEMLEVEKKKAMEKKEKEKEEKKTKQPLCAICSDKAPNHIALPCMHVFVCEDCIEGFKQSAHKNTCPLCRTNINKIVKVFYS